MVKRLSVFLLAFFIVVLPATLFANGSKESGATSSSGTAASSGTTAAPNIVLRFGTNHPADHSFVLGMKQTQKILNEKTNGRIKIQFFLNGVLGTEQQMQEQVAAGTLDMEVNGVINVLNPDFALFDFPYQYTNRAQTKAVMFSNLMMKTMNATVIPKGVRIIGVMEVGFRDITSNKPITEPSQLKGFKIRVPPSQAQMETFKTLGAIPTTIAYTELYSALQQHVVDGQENPLENIYTDHMYEVQKYVDVTRHIYNFGYVIISEKTWNRLSPSDQQILAGAVKQGCLWQIDHMKAAEATYEKELKAKGMIFVNADIPAFKNAVQPVYDSEFVKSLGPQGQNILSQIKQIVASVKETN